MKKGIIIALGALLTLSVAGGVAGTITKNNFAKKIDINQIQSNEENKVNISWNTDEDIKNIKVQLKSSTRTAKTIKLTDSQINSGQFTVSGIDGKYSVETTIEGKGIFKSTSKENKFTHAVDEVNIAPLSASMPVLLFTLAHLNTSDNISSNATIPTYVGLIRSRAYDWDQLPEGMYAIPTTNVKSYSGAGATSKEKEKLINDSLTYVKDLLSVNAETKVNFYINDYDTYYYFEILKLFKNKQDQFTVTFITDGSASYDFFNTTYNGKTSASEIYNTQKEKYTALKDKVINFGMYSPKEESLSIDDLRSYTYLITKENENCSWWLPRVDMFKANEDNFIPTDLSTIGVYRKNIGPMLSEIQAKENGAQQLKSLYKFNDDLFSKSGESGNKIMMFLGSWLVSPSYDTNGEADFEDYAKFTMAYYGDEYDYYYKGHPKSPTNMFPDRVKLLNELEVLDIESSIAAELILFFFPDIYMSGFDSSTYQSVQSIDMACVMWNTSKEEAFSRATYAKLIGMYVTKLDTNDAKYGSLIKDGHKSYLVEFSDYKGTTEDGENAGKYLERYNNNYAKHEIAIYDTVDNSITYYKLNGTTFVKVDA